MELALALALAQRRIRSRIVGPTVAPEDESRPILVPGGLEVIRSLGLLQEVMDAGLVSDRYPVTDRRACPPLPCDFSGLADVTPCPFAVEIRLGDLADVIHRALVATGLIEFRPEDHAGSARPEGRSAVTLRADGRSIAFTLETIDLDRGLAEVRNAAWKLDAILSGRGESARLIASFEAERRGTPTVGAATLADCSARIRGLGTGRAWRRHLACAIAALGVAAGFGQALALARSGLRLRPGASPLLHGRGLVGRRVPDVRIGEGRLSDRIGRWGLLLMRSAEPDGVATARMLGLPAASMPPGLDQHGFVGCAALYVRPDGIIACQAGSGERLRAAEVAAAMGRISPMAGPHATGRASSTAGWG